eukprot:Plantae.Rhodophyta-Purpureofilum_apyrenoidigerum.ctg4639.p1 GENE.Plantae.Rhodophyta-Purpureofilum_apyrenoidigerum.ctg4639~~Plantae.Rhodophyta-Purpureofilum_apyrenoidigerum.ctg4639.p1  ORF type:complete len:417 (-),score=53.15 Plantae.Rhodophyta-Purpureofilum_apyrenoidigerum.ctg4639:390-1640(-)
MRTRSLPVVLLLSIVLCGGNAAASWSERFFPVYDEQECCVAQPPPVAQTTVVLVFAHSRHECLERTLQSLVKHHPRKGFVVVVSQDMQDRNREYPLVNEVIQKAHRTAPPGVDIVHWRHTSPVNIQDVQTHFINIFGYHKISRHYFWALHNVFASQKVRRVIILEDDIDIAADFFEYFTATAHLLDNDPTLYCVSAWNDNGKRDYVQDRSRLYRTDWMPGYGWMMTRRLWQELAPKWPSIYWDDWLRAPEQRRGRQCIRPEVSRVANFGEMGISKGQDYRRHVSQVILNDEFVQFTTMNLNYLDPDEFRDFFFAKVSNATLMKSPSNLRHFPVARGDAIILYNDLANLVQIERRKLNLHIDPRHDVHRTSYMGYVLFTQTDERVRDRTRRVYLTNKQAFLSQKMLPGGFRMPTKSY